MSRTRLLSAATVPERHSVRCFNKRVANMKKITFAAMLALLVCIGCDSRQAAKGAEPINGIEVPVAQRQSRADELAHMDMHFNRFRTALAEASATPPSAQPGELAKLQEIKKVIAVLPVQDACLAAANKIRVE
jgi:hypothetical protein